MESPLIAKELAFESLEKNNTPSQSSLKKVFYVILLCLLLLNVVSLYRGLISQVLSSQPVKCAGKYDLYLRNISGEKEIIDVAFFGKYAYRNMKIMRGIARTVGSILRNTDSAIQLHVLLDLPSKKRVGRTLTKVHRHFRRKMNVTYYDVEEIADNFRDVINTMKHHFFSKDVGRYNDDIFFMSEIFHIAIPLRKVIFLDVDLKFMTNIQELYDEFDEFHPRNIIGIAPDLQPQYRNDFKKFRESNPGTPVGSPRPGFQGFNTGVVLFNLQKMRESFLYNSLLNASVVGELCKKYKFEGYLGHQDFFTLTGMEHPSLYYHLDCTWNRQLDSGWRKNFGNLMFDLYHSCLGKAKIYHGNGESHIPDS